MNHCVCDKELIELDAALQAADPGDWRVKDGAVVRYGGAPMERPDASLRLMARAVTAIPRLLRGIRVLEEALRSAWNAHSIALRELRDGRDGREADAVRRSEGATGPSREIAVLARLAALGVYQDNGQYLERLLRTWTGGGSIDEKGVLTQQVIAAERAARERAEIARTVKAEDDALRARLRDWAQRLDAGEVPDGMRAQWKRGRK